MDLLSAHRFIDEATSWATKPALTEDELVAKAIRYSNSADRESLAALIDAMNIPNLPPAHFGDLTIHRKAIDGNYRQVHADLNKGLRAILARKISRVHVDALAASAAQMILIPERKLEHGRLAISYRYVTWNLWSALAYALLLLLDGSRSYGARLCQCQLKTCRRFFLAHPPKSGTGKWIRVYHAPECFKISQKQKPSERVRRFRDAKKAARRVGKAR